MAPKRIAILQSSYIPWKGYFDLMRGVDEFVLYDDAQFTKRDWRSRNRIKTPEGLLWLSVPVVVKGRFTQRIDETGLAEPDVVDRHWQSIRRAYGRADHFRDYAERLERLFATAPRDRLSALNHHLLIGLRDLLGITTPLTWSTAYGGDGSKTARLVDLCVRAGATEYVSGPAARAYIEPALFEAAGITLLYADYAGYPEYPQLHPPFEHAVSVIDLLVHTGADASRYLIDVVPAR